MQFIVNLGAAILSISALFMVPTWGLWFWISNSSWINASTNRHYNLIYCLDFRFRSGTMAGSIVITRLPQFLPADSLLIEVADSARVSETSDKANKLVGIMDDLRQPYVLSGTMPFGHQLLDMDIADKENQPVGTVTFTYWPEEFTKWPYTILADLKSSRDTSVEHKVFKRAADAKDNERCAVQP